MKGLTKGEGSYSVGNEDQLSFLLSLRMMPATRYASPSFGLGFGLMFDFVIFIGGSGGRCAVMAVKEM